MPPEGQGSCGTYTVTASSRWLKAAPRVFIPCHFTSAAYRTTVAPNTPEKAIRHRDVDAAIWKPVGRPEMVLPKGYRQGGSRGCQEGAFFCCFPLQQLAKRGIIWGRPPACPAGLVGERVCRSYTLQARHCTGLCQRGAAGDNGPHPLGGGGVDKQPMSVPFNLEFI